MTFKIFIFFIVLLQTTSVLAMPKIKVTHQRNNQGFAEVKVANDTVKNLICSVAIDGHKTLFHLKPLAFSKWYTATDIRYNHTHFSIWCDYLELHPKYQ